MKISEVIPPGNCGEDVTDIPEDSSSPRPNRVQNQGRSFQDLFKEIVIQSSTEATIDSHLQSGGLKVRKDWLENCVSHSNSVEHIFQKFLSSDINLTCGGVGGGALPNLMMLPEQKLSGPFFLQVNDIANTSLYPQDKYQDVPSGIKRRLRLTMTDGVQDVVGLEYRPIDYLSVSSPAGLKVVVRNVTVRNGILMLVPGVLEVLGGKVEHLEAARKKLIEELNKVPRTQTWDFDNSILREDVIPSRSSIEDLSLHDWENEQMSTNAGSVPAFGEAFINNSQNLTEDKGISFTYLATVLDSAKMADDASCAPSNIKCYSTGTEGFKKNPEDEKYGFVVVVADGSHTSRILIDHTVVQSQMGCSPEVVIGALSSPDTDVDGKMRKTLELYETMLLNFRGTLCVKRNKNSDVLVALSMKKCTVDDCWFLEGEKVGMKQQKKLHQQ